MDNVSLGVEVYSRATKELKPVGILRESGFSTFKVCAEGAERCGKRTETHSVSIFFLSCRWVDWFGVEVYDDVLICWNLGSFFPDEEAELYG